MERIISRNSPLPAKGSRIFTTADDYQTSMDIQILQGERELAVDNVFLGRLHLEDLPSAVRGVPKVEVVFEVGVDGTVEVSASDLFTENEVKTKVISTKLLDSVEIEQIMRDARESAERDSIEVEKIRAKIKAENLISVAERMLEEKIDDDDSDEEEDDDDDDDDDDD